MKNILFWSRDIAANVGAALIAPTCFIAFCLGIVVVLHVRAFIHGWNIARQV